LINFTNDFSISECQSRKQLISCRSALILQCTSSDKHSTLATLSQGMFSPSHCPDLQCDESAYHYKLESLIFRNETLIAFARQSDKNITALYHDCNIWQLANICLDQHLPLAQPNLDHTYLVCPYLFSLSTFNDASFYYIYAGNYRLRFAFADIKWLFLIENSKHFLLAWPDHHIH